MTQDETEVEKVSQTVTSSDKKAAEDAAYHELVGTIDELLPPINVPKEAPPILTSLKKREIVVGKKDNTPSVLKMKLKDIELSETWNRDKLQNIDKLTNSILAEGQIVPLVVFYRPDGKAQLIDGRRRYAALKEAGIQEALVVVSSCTDEKVAQFQSLITNLAREDHTPLELCRTFSGLRDMGKTVKEIAAANAKYSENQVSQYLRLECLPDDAKKMLNAGKLEVTAALALCRLNFDDPRAVKFFDKIIGMVKIGKIASLTVAAAVDNWVGRRREVDKAAGKKEEKKRGRKTAIKQENYDYTAPSYLKAMKPLSAKQVGAYLNALQEKKNKARSPGSRKGFDFEMRGAQKVMSLMDLD
jgi:ParB/RepB/Spo0J family partition protein